MELKELLKKLAAKYAFLEIDYHADDQIPNLEVCFHLTPPQVTTVITKVNKMDDYIHLCANMALLADSSLSRDELMQTSIRCEGSNLLYIRSTPTMVKLLIDIILG